MTEKLDETNRPSDALTLICNMCGDRPAPMNAMGHLLCSSRTGALMFACSSCLNYRQLAVTSTLHPYQLVAHVGHIAHERER